MTDELSSCATWSGSSTDRPGPQPELAAHGAEVAVMVSARSSWRTLVAWIEAAGGTAARCADITGRGAASWWWRRPWAPTAGGHPGEQRRGDAAEPGPGRAGRGLETDGRRQRPWPALHPPRSTCSKRRTAARSRPDQRQAPSGGRSVRPGNRVYNPAKWGVGALGESMRRKLASKRARGDRPESHPHRTAGGEPPGGRRRSATGGTASAGWRLQAYQDLADAVGYMVTRPRHVNRMWSAPHRDRLGGGGMATSPREEITPKLQAFIRRRHVLRRDSAERRAVR